MKKLFITSCLFSIALILAGCQDKSPQNTQSKKQAPAGHAQTASIKAEGTVVSTMKAGRYIYVELKRDDGTVWIAGPETDVKVGDKVSHGPGAEMYNFKSESLGRTFDLVLFVDSITVEKGS